MKITFEELKLKATRKWINEDGKKQQETRTFSQTVNPFNKNANGNVKTRDEIMRELRFDRDLWINGDR